MFICTIRFYPSLSRKWKCALRRGWGLFAQVRAWIKFLNILQSLPLSFPWSCSTKTVFPLCWTTPSLPLILERHTCQYDLTSVQLSTMLLTISKFFLAFIVSVTALNCWLAFYVCSGLHKWVLVLLGLILLSTLLVLDMELFSAPYYIQYLLHQSATQPINSESSNSDMRTILNFTLISLRS